MMESGELLIKQRKNIGQSKSVPAHTKAGEDLLDALIGKNFCFCPVPTIPKEQQLEQDVNLF